MWKEFKEFVVRGNVMDLAVGLVLGAGFGRIVSSLVSDILMPPIGLILGHVDFANLFIILGEKQYDTLAAAKAAGAATINYGVFLTTVIDFLIVAFVIFIVVKQINRIKRPAPAPVVSTRDCPFCLSAIPLKATRCAFCTSEIKTA